MGKFRITGRAGDDRHSLHLETDEEGAASAVAEDTTVVNVDVYQPGGHTPGPRIIIDAEDGVLSVGIDTGHEIAIMTLTPTAGGGYLLSVPDSYDDASGEFAHATVSVRSNPWARQAGHPDLNVMAGPGNAGEGQRGPGPGAVNAGDIGGDEQITAAWSVRFTHVTKPGSLLTVAFYGEASDPDAPATYRLTRQDEYLTCTDPGDPGGSQDWCEYAFTDVTAGRTFTSGDQLGRAAIDAARELTSDSLLWDGEPFFHLVPGRWNATAQPA